MRMSRTRALAASLTLLGCASLPNLAVGLQAEPTGGVSVGVTDAVSGELIPAASVSMIDAEGLLWAELSVGADGRRVADVVAPGPATVGVYATGYTAPSGESFEIVVVGGETTMLDVALEPRLMGGVSVGVTDAVSGELIPAASVSMIDAEGLLWAELSVGADGRRVADVVAPGPATVGVYATGYTAPSGESFEIVVVGGETTMLDVALELSRPPASTVPPSSSTEPPPETVAANALPVTGGRLNAALLSVGFVMLVLGVQAVLAARRP